MGLIIFLTYSRNSEASRYPCKSPGVNRRSWGWGGPRNVSKNSPDDFCSGLNWLSIGGDRVLQFLHRNSSPLAF